MNFTAYRRADGAFVLVPDCLVASREAQIHHGPLTLVGRVAADGPPDDPAWRRILRDIDHHTYAVVRSQTGEALVRTGAPYPA